MLPHQHQHEVTTRAAALTPTTSHPLAYVGSDPGCGAGQVPTSGVLLQNSSSTRQPQPDAALTTTVPAGPAPASAPVPGFAPTIFSISTTAPTTVSSSSATATKTASTLRPPSPPPRTLPRRLISFCRRVVQRIRPPPVRISSYYYPHQHNQSLDADAALGETTAGASTLASASVIMSPTDTGGKRRPNTAMPMPGASASSSSSRSAAAGIAAAAAAGSATTSSKMSFSLGDRVTKPNWPSPPVSPGMATGTGTSGTTAVGAPPPAGGNTTTTATPSSPTTSSSWSRRRWFSLASPTAIGKRASTSAGLDTSATTNGTSDHEAESGTRTSASTTTTHHSSPVRTLPGGGAEFAAWFAPPPRPFVARPMAYINTNGSASPYGDLGNGGDAQWNIEVDPEPLLRRRRFHAGESITGESSNGARPVAGAHASGTPVGSATNSRESGRSHGHDQLGNGYANGSGSASTIWPSTPRTMDSAASSVTTLFVNGGGSSGLSGGGHGGCGASICSTQHPSSIYTTNSTGTNGGKQRTTRSAGNGRPRTPLSAPATANANAIANATTPVLPRSGSLSTTTTASGPGSAGGPRIGVGHSNSAASLLTTQTSLTACTASATVAAQRRQTVPRMDSRSLNEATTREQQRHRREQQQQQQQQRQDGQQNSQDRQEQQHRQDGQQRHHHHHHHQPRQEAHPQPRYDGQPPPPPQQHQQAERRPKQRAHRPRPQVNTGPLTMPTGTGATTTPPSAAASASPSHGGSESQRRRVSLRPRSPTLSDIYRDLHISPARSRARMVDLNLNVNGIGNGPAMVGGALRGGDGMDRPDGGEGGDANGSAEPARRNGSASASASAAGKGWW